MKQVRSSEENVYTYGREKQEDGENYIMRNFVISTLYHIVL
jgi:hypothetical protein